MLAAIDIGNTHVTFALYQRARLAAHWRIDSSGKGTMDELWSNVENFFGDTRKTRDGIQGIVVASVVPKQTSVFVRTAAKHSGCKPMVIGGMLDFGMKIRTSDPSRVGADRLCSAIAAYTKFGGPVISVDFGTATTFNVVSKNGEFLGGVIAPGIATSAAALHRRTAQLPRIDLRFPRDVIGRNTIGAMQSGVMFSALDACDGIIRRIRGVIGRRAPAVATGGFAETVAKMSGEFQHVEPFLVLDGARIIYERVTQDLQ